MQKKKLRKELLDKRNRIPAATRKTKNASIKQRLEELEIYKQAYTVLFYVSFGSEVDTHRLIKDVFKEKKKVAVPLVSQKDLEIKQITSLKQLSPGTMGILEPSSEQSSVELADINIIIVPGVAFDKEHYRLGYGGGYYDRLLEQFEIRNSKFEIPPTIGLAFEEQIVEKLPVAEHDQKVDFVVTDKKII